MKRNTDVGTPMWSRVIVVLALFAGAAAAQPTHRSDTDRAFDAAMVAYERNHWDAAYTAFSALADRGNPEAARIALQMWLHGPALYRMSFAANTQQVGRWARLWACGSGQDAGACAQLRPGP